MTETEAVRRMVLNDRIAAARLAVLTAERTVGGGRDLSDADFAALRSAARVFRGCAGEITAFAGGRRRQPAGGGDDR